MKFLVLAGQEARDVNKSDDWDVEGITMAHKACRLLGGSDVQSAGKLHGLVGHNAHGVAFNAPIANHDVGGVKSLHLQEVRDH